MNKITLFLVSSLILTSSASYADSPHISCPTPDQIKKTVDTICFNNALENNNCSSQKMKFSVITGDGLRWEGDVILSRVLGKPAVSININPESMANRKMQCYYSDRKSIGYFMVLRIPDNLSRKEVPLAVNCQTNQAYSDDSACSIWFPE